MGKHSMETGFSSPLFVLFACMLVQEAVSLLSGKVRGAMLDLRVQFCLTVIVWWSTAFRTTLGTYNVDPSFSRWPTKSAIPFYLDTSYYTTTEQSYIRAGVNKIMADLQGCVTFVETTASDPRFKIFVTPYNDAGVLQTFCYSPQGQVNSLVNSGALFQRMIITRGTQYGCLDGSLHNIMRYFAIVLGKRNEHQRGDRETYIAVNDANIAVPNSYRLYSASEAYWNLFAYDYCSITHNKVNDYSNTGTNAFTVRTGPAAIPFLDRISQTDCQLLSMIYNCPSDACPSLDCNLARQNALPPTPAACPSNYFCTHPVDESSFLLGPMTRPEVMLMFSGPCVMEYKYGWVDNYLFNPLGPPVPITTYFPPPGGPTDVVPVNVAFSVLAVDGSSYPLTTANSASGTGLTCIIVPDPSDPSGNTITRKCPTPSGKSATITNALSQVSSVTSQIYLATNDVYQYVVLKPGNNEIALMNADFTTTYAKSTGFLSGGAPIVTITAIQILQDQTNVDADPTILAVFGTDASGNPYVGYVDLLLTADPVLPIGPWKWLQSPVPLASQLSKYCP